MNPARHAWPLFALALACSGATPAAEISAETLLAQLSAPNAPLVVDVRTAEEFAAGHVPGAINIPHDQVASREAEFAVEGEREIVVYCKSGKRAGMALEALAASGIRATHLEGDMLGWIAAGHPQE